MGYWQNTTYVEHGNVRDVALAIDEVFANEGMSRMDPPPHKPITAADGIAAHYRWSGPSRQRRRPGDSFDPWRRIS